MSKQIVVIGSSNTDMVITAKTFPMPGETLMGGSFMVNQGGKGANQAVAAARLGGDVTFIAKLGNDLFGAQAITQYQADKINTSFIATDSVNPTGVALITVNAEGENTIIVAAGANATLSKEEILKAEEAILKSEVVLIQLEIPLNVVEFVLNYAKQNNKRVILNPAPAAVLNDAILNNLFLISPNQTEAELLCNSKIANKEDVIKSGQFLLNKGIQNVIITLGSEGCYFVNQQESFFTESIKVKTVDTTAAGDVFNGALAVAIADGKPMREAIFFASKAASISVTKVGAQASAPYLKDII